MGLVYPGAWMAIFIRPSALGGKMYHPSSRLKIYQVSEWVHYTPGHSKYGQRSRGSRHVEDYSKTPTPVEGSMDVRRRETRRRTTGTFAYLTCSSGVSWRIARLCLRAV
jgi:hypothetical protein